LGPLSACVGAGPVCTALDGGGCKDSRFVYKVLADGASPRTCVVGNGGYTWGEWITPTHSITMVQPRGFRRDFCIIGGCPIQWPVVELAVAFVVVVGVVGWTGRRLSCCIQRIRHAHW